METIFKYGENADKAAKELTGLGVETSKVEALRIHLNGALENIELAFRKAMKLAMPSEDSWDSVNYGDGQTSALEWARQEGITDQAILKAIGNFGFHYASVKIQLHLNECRDLADD